MALAHLSVRAHSRTRGHTVAAALAYRQGVNLRDYRDGQRSDFRWRSKRREVLASGFSYGRVPVWDPDDPQAFADALERAETRVNSCVARDVEIALPHELTLVEQIQLARYWADILAARYGCAVAFAVHASDAEGDERNTHAHFLVSTRSLTEDGTLGDKIRAFHGPAGVRGGPEIRALRAEWERTCNAALERAGHEVRIDMGRKKVGRAARHLGHKATALERTLRRKRHENKGREQQPGRASAADLVTDNSRNGGCATDRGAQLARHVAEQVSVEEGRRGHLLDPQPDPTPIPVRRRRRRPRHDRAPRARRLRQSRAHGERRETEVGSVENEMSVELLDSQPGPVPMSIVPAGVREEPRSRVEVVQAQPGPRPADIGAIDRDLAQVRQQMWDRENPDRALFHGRGAWPQVQQQHARAFAAAIQVLQQPGIENGADRLAHDGALARQVPLTTYFLTPEQSVVLLREMATRALAEFDARERERAIREQQRRRIDYGRSVFQHAVRCHASDWQAVKFDAEGCTLPVSVAVECALETLPEWAQNTIRSGLTTLGLAEDVISVIHIPVHMDLTNPAARKQGSEPALGRPIRAITVDEAVEFMLRKDRRTRRLPTTGNRQFTTNRESDLPLYTIWSDTSGAFTTDQKELALREATQRALVQKCGFEPGAVFSLRALYLEDLASRALGRTSMMTLARRQGSPNADQEPQPEATGRMPTGGGGHAGDPRSTSPLRLFPRVGHLVGRAVAWLRRVDPRTLTNSAEETQVRQLLDAPVGRGQLSVVDAVFEAGSKWLAGRMRPISRRETEALSDDDRLEFWLRAIGNELHFAERNAGDGIVVHVGPLRSPRAARLAARSILNEVTEIGRLHYQERSGQPPHIPLSSTNPERQRAERERNERYRQALAAWKAGVPGTVERVCRLIVPLEIRFRSELRRRQQLDDERPPTGGEMAAADHYLDGDRRTGRPALRAVIDQIVARRFDGQSPYERDKRRRQYAIETALRPTVWARRSAVFAAALLDTAFLSIQRPLFDNHPEFAPPSHFVTAGEQARLARAIQTWRRRAEDILDAVEQTILRFEVAAWRRSDRTPPTPEEKRIADGSLEGDNRTTEPSLRSAIHAIVAERFDGSTRYEPDKRKRRQAIAAALRPVVLAPRSAEIAAARLDTVLRSIERDVYPAVRRSAQPKAGSAPHQQDDVRGANRTWGERAWYVIEEIKRALLRHEVAAWKMRIRRQQQQHNRGPRPSQTRYDR